MGSITNSTKPLVVIGCTGFSGYVIPTRAVAKELIGLGYEVTLVTTSHFRESIEEIGCTFVGIEGYADYWEGEPETKFPERQSFPTGPLQLSFDIEMNFVRTIPNQHAAMQKAMEMLTAKHPGRPIVQVNEALFHGGLPIMNGARGIKPTATLGLGINPMALSSIDCAPFGPAILPDSSPEGRIRNQALLEEIELRIFGKPKTVVAEIYEQLETKWPALPYLDASYLFPDQFLQLSIPSAEYPKSDAPDTIGFAGGWPKGARSPSTNLPSWWPEVIENREKKDIVFVCQGTLSLDYSDLIIPTLEALENRSNTLVVVAIGRKTASFPGGTHIPRDTRVEDFLPCDEILPYCRVFVTNGGQGGFLHAISNGIPLLVAGATEDKPETCARAEWSGMAVNLRTGRPTVEAIMKGVEELISVPKYKTRVLEMQAEMATFDPMSIISRTIEELVAGKGGKPKYLNFEKRAIMKAATEP